MMYRTLHTYLDMNLDVNRFKSIGHAIEKIGARLSASLVEISPPPPTYVYGVPYSTGVPYRSGWYEDVKKRAKQIEARADKIHELMSRLNIHGEVDALFCTHDSLQNLIVRQTSLVDLVFMPRDHILDEGLHQLIISQILFDAPVGLFVPGPKTEMNFAPQKIMIAWDASPRAAQAVHRALPMIKQADDIIIAMFDPQIAQHGRSGEPGADVAQWLAHHDCTVEIQHYPTSGKEVGACLTQRAIETGADCVVMGAYGHAKFLQRLFGGTTRYMLEQDDVSVFLSH